MFISVREAHTCQRRDPGSLFCCRSLGDLGRACHVCYCKDKRHGQHCRSKCKGGNETLRPLYHQATFDVPRSMPARVGDRGKSEGVKRMRRVQALRRRDLVTSAFGCMGLSRKRCGALLSSAMKRPAAAATGYFRRNRKGIAPVQKRLNDIWSEYGPDRLGSAGRVMLYTAQSVSLVLLTAVSLSADPERIDISCNETQLNLHA